MLLHTLPLTALAVAAALTLVIVGAYHLGITVGQERARRAILSHPSVRRSTPVETAPEVTRYAVINRY